MNRLQAINLLKKLVDNDLVELTYISLNETKPDSYQIQIKSNCNRQAIEQYAKKMGLTISDESEQYLTIYQI
jgi:hypothetical protein